ncbi:MAG: endolytic transglycosylase MltG [Flavobacteriaceae bacterium]|nr:endolytic transglycosylase MltG [Flavobacteriaceae bacterium]
MYIKRILLIIALLGLAVAAYIVYNIYGTIFDPNTSFENEEAILYIPTEATFDQVAERLQPLLKNLETFTVVAEKKGYTKNIKAGRYRIKKGMNNNQIVNNLRSGNIPVRVAFNNQERVENLAGRIAQQIEADSVSLMKAFTDPVFVEESGFTQEDKLAMYLPNSYEFYWNTSAQKFRERMLAEYRRYWNEKRRKKAIKLGLTPNEVISLAAIVHKETAKVSERPRVAGLYLNRIRKGMFLEADPTVIYALKKHQNNFELVIKRVLYKDLEIDSEYNTYRHIGVPPGPITMPDISAVEAVLNAEKHDYLFMVADVDNFGYHKFAKSMAQHNRNANSYRRWANEMNIKR